MTHLKPYRIPERIYFADGELRVEGEMLMYLASDVEALREALEHAARRSHQYSPHLCPACKQVEQAITMQEAPR